MKFFITYGDEKFQTARDKIVHEAQATGEFDKVIPYGRSDVTKELTDSEIFKIPRGGGLWSWKPDIIWQTMEYGTDGDIIVYCDSACTIQACKEWCWYWEKLRKYDIIAQRIFCRNDRWTRREIADELVANVKNWEKCYQYQATIIIIISPFTRKFISEWRTLMLHNPILAMDVTEEERAKQPLSLVENRHDQAIYSALIYKYLSDTKNKGKIYTMWEHIENYDPIFKQAIRATRLRHGETENSNLIKKRILCRLVKDYVLKTFYYSPLQYWYSRNL